MKAGTAIRAITPWEPIQLCGYPESPVSTGVHDELYLAAYYLADKRNETLYLTADLCFFARRRADKITAAVSAATGVPEDHILLAATHTHYAPATDCDIYNQTFGPELCPDYMDFVQLQAVSAAAEAKKTAFPALITAGCGICGKEQDIGGNRHDPEKYTQDPSVGVLAIADEAGALRGVLVNYALHPTVLETSTSLVAADFVAYMRETVKKDYPQAVFGFMQGCSGNQSSRYFRRKQTFAEAKRFGDTIGAEVVRILRGLEFRPDGSALSVQRIAFYPSYLRDIPAMEEARREVQTAKSSYMALVAAGVPAAACRSAECALLGAQMMAMYARDAEKFGKQAVLDTTVPVDIHLVTWGDVAILGISAEVFADVGLAVRANSPFRVNLFSCLTGGSPQSYICSDYAYKQRYYEPAGSLFGRGTAEELSELLITSIQPASKNGRTCRNAGDDIRQ